jgi:glutaredoxin
MNIILYTTGCPNCKILEKLLKLKKINYNSITDIQKMIEMGFLSVPQLYVDGILMDYNSAKAWVSKYND